MKLYERLFYLHETPRKIAKDFAEFMRWDDEADREQIIHELGAMLKYRAELTARFEEPRRCGAWEDFKDIPPEPALRPNYVAILETIAIKAEEIAVKTATAINISTLDTLFVEVCRALNYEGIKITGGEISALKRSYAVPQRLYDELEALKRDKIPTIPEAERLSDEEAEKLYNGLARYGFISGTFEAFKYHFGESHHTKHKSENKGICWRGSKAQFAFFAWLLTMHTQKNIPGNYIIREKAVCLAFGFDDRAYMNTIRPYFADFRRGKRTGCKGGEQIKRIFENLTNVQHIKTITG